MRHPSNRIDIQLRFFLFSRTLAESWQIKLLPIFSFIYLSPIRGWKIMLKPSRPAFATQTVARGFDFLIVFSIRDSFFDEFFRKGLFVGSRDRVRLFAR